MKLNPNDLPKHIQALNPHLFMGGVETRLTKPSLARALDNCNEKCKGGKGSVVVSLCAYRRRILDDDNNVASCKPLRDAIAASIGIDDGDSRIKWEYGQIETRGQQGVMVKIETHV